MPEKIPPTPTPPAPAPAPAPKPNIDSVPKFGTPAYEQLVAEKMQLCNFRREDAIVVIEQQRVHDKQLAKAK